MKVSHLICNMLMFFEEKFKGFWKSPEEFEVI